MHETRYKQFDRIDSYLCMWAAWMRSRKAENGFPGKSPGFVCGGSVRSLDDLVEQCDSEAVRIVDGLYESLTPVQQCAVLNHWGLQRVWRSGRGDIEKIYEEAKEIIERGLNKWGLP